MTYQDRPAVPQPIKLTVDDYLLLDEAGAFQDYGRTQLIDGTILVMNAAYSRHARILSELYLEVALACRDATPRLVSLIDPSVRVDLHNLPQPDIAVFREVPPEGVLPLTGLLLAIEVADSSRGLDLGRKASLYADGGVPEYWVADTTTGILHQFWQPHDARFDEERRVTFGERLIAATLPLSIGLPSL